MRKGLGSQNLTPSFCKEQLPPKIQGYPCLKGGVTINALFVINAVFNTGQLVATRGVYNHANENPDFADFIQKSLNRHVKGDWGDVDDEDKLTNDRALKQGLRLLSAYNDDCFPQHGNSTIWIITEADRSATTILFPDEY